MKRITSVGLIVGVGLSLNLGSANAQTRLTALESEYNPKQNVTLIFARERLIEGNISYSSGYFFPSTKFSVPKFVSFTIYGYHQTPQWANVKTVTFTYNGQKFIKKPLYTSKGPERDKSQDMQASPYFETLIVEMPVSVAQAISKNKGVLVTTEPDSFYITVPASRIEVFKQLIDSITVLSKPQKVVKRPISKIARNGKTPPGLPITEIFDDSSGITTLSTKEVLAQQWFGISAVAGTAYQGKRLPQPFTYMDFSTFTLDAPKWSGARSVVLSFGNKKLGLTPHVGEPEQMEQQGRRAFIEKMRVRVPYKDFVNLASGGKFYITIGEATMEMSVWNASGIRALAAKIKR